MELFGILIPLLALGIPIVAVWTKHRERMQELGGADADLAKRIQALEARNAELDERVQTLETIVTLDEPPQRVRVSSDLDLAEQEETLAALRAGLGDVAEK